MAEPREDDLRIPQLKSLQLSHLQNDFKYQSSPEETLLPYYL